MFVFDADNEFKAVDNISLGDMNGPTDMVYCAESGHIYIAGKSSSEDLVIRLSLDGKQVEPWLPNKSTTTLTAFSVWSLSMTSERLLVTSKEHLELRLHRPDGTEDKVIKLSDSKGLWHAVETARGTFVVAHAAPQSQITEVNSEGVEIRIYQGSVGLGDSYHLVVDSDGRIIVADWKKDRILLFNDRLELERVLLDDVSNPTRLCLVEKTGQLFVGSWMSNCVELYQIGLKTC